MNSLEVHGVLVQKNMLAGCICFLLAVVSMRMAEADEGLSQASYIVTNATYESEPLFSHVGTLIGITADSFQLITPGKNAKIQCFSLIDNGRVNENQFVEFASDPQLKVRLVISCIEGATYSAVGKIVNIHSSAILGDTPSYELRRISDKKYGQYFRFINRNVEHEFTRELFGDVVPPRQNAKEQ